MIKFQIHWVELAVAALLGSYASYFFLCFSTDIRIDSIRPFITEQAVKEGVAAAKEEWTRQHLADEHLMIMKRKKRDAALKELGKKYDKILEMGP